MSIRSLALALYQAQQEMDRCQRELAVARPEQTAAAQDALRQAQAQWQVLRRMLDGEKESARPGKKFW